MKVKVTADEQTVENWLREEGCITEADEGFIEGIHIEDLVEAVLQNLTFEFDRENVEVATVIPFRGKR